MNNFEEIIIEIRNILETPFVFGVYRGKERNFCVYVEMFVDKSASDNMSNIAEVHLILTFYRSDNFHNYKSNIMCKLRKNKYIVSDMKYSDVENETGLYTFALEIVKEVNYE